MKAFATNATLIATEQDTGLKTYKVLWTDKDGHDHTDVAQGLDMKTALSTVLRKRELEKIKRVPEWAWFSIYSIFIGTYTVAAFTLNKPLLIVLGCATLLLAVKLVAERYFRYVR